MPRPLPLIALLLASGTACAGDTLVARGEYLAHIAGCVACHTDNANKGPLLAGGKAIDTDRGAFHPPNITPDPEHGIGGWSVEDLALALKEGVAPDGRHYFPAFPYTSYTGLRDDDIVAIKAYLDTVPAVARPNRPHRLSWYLSGPAAWAWKLLYFTPDDSRQHQDRSPRRQRGAYLVEAVGHCGECHSPRNRAGAIDESLRLAGTNAGPEGEAVPNITPHKRTGIGGWSAADLAYYLRTGADPEGDYAGGLMGEVIDHGLSRLTPEDARAMADYLLSLPPVDHAVTRDEPSTDADESYL